MTAPTFTQDSKFIETSNTYILEKYHGWSGRLPQPPYNGLANEFITKGE